MAGCGAFHRVEHQVLTVPKLKPPPLPLSTEVPTCESPHPPCIGSASVHACSTGMEGKRWRAGAVKSGLSQPRLLSGCLPLPLSVQALKHLRSAAFLDGGLAYLCPLLWLPCSPMNCPTWSPVKHWAVANDPFESGISTFPSFWGIVGKCGGLNENSPQRLIYLSV